MTRIKIDKKEDSEQLGTVLINNGYEVKIDKEKVTGSKLAYFVEYE